MKLNTYATAVAAMLLVTACSGSGSDAGQTTPGSSTTPDTADVPGPVAPPPLLLGSETIYSISSGDAYEYFTLQQGEVDPDGFRQLSLSYADENGPRPPFLDYKLTKNGWSLSENIIGIRLDDGGATLTYRDRSDGNLGWTRYREVDVSGKLVTSYLSDYFRYRKDDLVLIKNAVFPPGSRLAQTFDNQPKNPQYDLSSPPSPYRLSSNVSPSSIADLLERATTSDPVCVGNNKHSALAFTGTASQGSGTVTAYEADEKTSVPCTITGPARATGTWELRAVNGANILVLTLPGLDDADLEPAFGGYNLIGVNALTTFNEIDGKVVQGYFLPAVTTLPPESETRAGYLLNPTAWNFVKARLPIK